MSDIRLSEKAYRYIHGKLLRGEWAMGRTLSEKGLAEEIGISRTPLREAIQRLAREGFVEQQPRVGTVVQTFGRDQVIEWFGFLEAIETHAAAAAAANFNGEVRLVLEQLCRQMESVTEELPDEAERRVGGLALHRYLDLEAGFHRIMTGLSSNGLLVEHQRRMHHLIRFVAIQRHLYTCRMLSDSLAWHRRIVSALTAADPNAAASLVSDHLRRTRNQMLHWLERSIPPGLDPKTMCQDVLKELDLPAESWKTS
ncbi:MAG: GntR family transcriptional regulator [Phycisphaeraceae bacterium]|nr:GntR family transcriptional regulator [Phycisphaeraceae bacterium]